MAPARKAGRRRWLRSMCQFATGLLLSATMAAPLTAHAGHATTHDAPVKEIGAPGALACSSLDLTNPLLVLVDREHALPRNYRPADLAPVPLERQNAYLDRTVLLRRAVQQPLLDLLAAANAEGLQLVVISGFRSYTEQALAYQKWKNLYPDRVDTISARPGHSEHQLGVAVDFSAVRLYYQLALLFARTPEGEWLDEHAADYGFTPSYPASAVDQTGYAWEPWHFRYVGGELARELADQYVTLGELVRRCSTGARTTGAYGRGLSQR